MTRVLDAISVIGAGAWGTALAQVYAEAGCRVTLYARDPGLAVAINETHRNDLYLPGLPLSPYLRATANLEEAADGAQALLIATPTQYVRDVLTRLHPHLKSRALIVNCAKGIEISTSKLLGEVAAEIVPDHDYAVLSGPTFASEVAKGLPAAVTLATSAPKKQAADWAQALSSRTFRPYLAHDPIGAEVAGAVKNVIAIACGVVEGRGLGQNARAAVMTRGMAEIKRLGLKKGAQAETFLGLSGIGDLTLTCHSTTSRNFSLGLELGRGHALEEIMVGRRTVAEGFTTAQAVDAAAHALGIEMPICAAVNRILHHQADVGTIIDELLSRHLKPEED